MKVIIMLGLSLLTVSAFAQWNATFSTRVSADLMISGKRCLGGEPSGVSSKNCLSGQWLLTYDDINHCRENGACTEAFVFPFIVELERVEIVSPKTVSFYKIKPKDRISLRDRVELAKYWVKFDLNGETGVIKKSKIRISKDHPKFITSDGRKVND
jgi:hypothetical protein